ncbi:MFS general substrate transporter [Meira miltonrushii]|uniref:MFS general substrate transporter n=1 Tax=Meira miltonrushii TaxID=1280837 RepID=A0A316V2T7_9BASI|nr:MFS general substrate transporter [Meira miltonrushii]PWN31564.1 MFS general substrate transporter [Meira miltonrushii]
MAGEKILATGLVKDEEVDWDRDPRNSRTWSTRKKWSATIASCYMSSLISVAASAYSQAVDGIQQDLHSSYLLTVSGISFFTFTVAIFPIILAPLGERFGRQPVYLITFALFFLFFLPNALAQNIQTVLISRFISGAVGSAGSTMVGGTLSDIWAPEQRQIPMSLFALSALLGTPMGLIGFTWAGGSISWRWIFWVLLMLAVPSFLAIALFFRHESLTKEMRVRLRQKSTSSQHDSFKERVLIPMLRPLFFLATEPITFVLSLWIAFAWGTLYLFLESIPLVFEPYGFTHEHMSRGLSSVGIGIGALIGFGVHMLVLRYRSTITRPEQRLPEACVGALLFSFGFFIFAWTAKPDKIHWIVPQLGTSVIMIGLYMVYICIFDYLADCYGSYTSSATAAQSFLRNILATAFALIAKRMYDTLSFPWASSLLGFCALILAFAPFLLLWKGRFLRERSPFASNQRGSI